MADSETSSSSGLDSDSSGISPPIQSVEYGGDREEIMYSGTSSSSGLDSDSDSDSNSDSDSSGISSPSQYAEYDGDREEIMCPDMFCYDTHVGDLVWVHIVTAEVSTYAEIKHIAPPTTRQSYYRITVDLAPFNETNTYVLSMLYGEYFEVVMGESVQDRRVSTGANMTNDVVGTGRKATRADREAKTDAYSDPQVAALSELFKGGIRTRAKYHCCGQSKIPPECNNHPLM